MPWDQPGPVVRAGLAWVASRQEHLRAGASCGLSLLWAVELGDGQGAGSCVLVVKTRRRAAGVTKALSEVWFKM